VLPVGPGPSNPSSKPRVVIADDHLLVRTAAARVLSARFDVVDFAANGRQAVEAASRLDPDVVVLDISMPELDGFQAAQALVRRGSRAKILFLSVYEGDDYVTAAVEAGARGYVVKSRMAMDLVTAVSNVLDGRLYVPSLSSLLNLAHAPARHAVQYATDGDTQVDELTRFASRAFRRGHVVVATGSPALLNGVETQLSRSGVDVAGLSERGRYLAFNAEEGLEQLMRDDEVDVERVAEFVGRLEEARRSADGESKGLAIFGDMAGVLMRQGHFKAALSLERTWHGLREVGAFHTVCSYQANQFATAPASEMFTHVAGIHGAVR
jgi:DNA-binding NarL/FixJ family response regulator